MLPARGIELHAGVCGQFRRAAVLRSGYAGQFPVAREAEFKQVVVRVVREGFTGPEIAIPIVDAAPGAVFDCGRVCDRD